MFRKIAAACALSLLALPAVSFGQFKAGDWEVTLSGSGANSPDFDGVSAAANGSLGYFFTPELELGARQSVTFSDVGGGGDLNGSTRVFLDYHFDLDKWQPYVGANVGFVYGDGVTDSWLAAPEAGIKYFVNPNTFVFVSIEYQFFFDEGGDDLDNSFSDGQFLYGLGIGFTF